MTKGDEKVSAVILIVLIGGAVFLRIWMDRKWREKHEVPKEALEIKHLGGLSGVREGNTFVWRDDNTVVFVPRKEGVRKTLPMDQIRQIQFNSDVRTVGVGGGSSLTGAVLGGAVAGGVGAIIASRKKTKVKRVDESTINITAATASGMEAVIRLKGNQRIYNRVADMLGASI